MHADDFFRYATDAVIILLFVILWTEALHRSQQLVRDAALFFTVLAVIVITSLAATAAGDVPGAVSDLQIGLLLALPYLLLRLAAYFIAVPPWVRWCAIAGWAAIVRCSLEAFLLTVLVVIGIHTLFPGDRRTRRIDGARVGTNPIPRGQSSL